MTIARNTKFGKLLFQKSIIKPYIIQFNKRKHNGTNKMYGSSMVAIKQHRNLHDPRIVYI